MLKKFIAVFAVIVFLLTGCNKAKEEPVKDHKGKDIEDVQKEELPNHFPLTGMATKEDISGRAVAVVVNNHPKARQQSGLDKADIIFELLAEGNVTRLLAIFQSEKPNNIGPVRSARDYYIELAKGYDGFFVAHGYSPSAKQKLDSGYIDNINGMYYDGTLFKRSSKRVAPHNSYISFENILKGAEKNNYSMEKTPESLLFLSKDEQKKINGVSGEKVTVSYFNNNAFTATYEYDSALKKYKRYSAGAQTVNEDTGNPVLLDNVLIVETDHQVFDESGRREIDLTSGGKGYLLQRGFIMTIEWKNDNGRIVPMLDGSGVGFVPGKTWINFVPTNPGLSSMVKVETN